MVLPLTSAPTSQQTAYTSPLQQRSDEQVRETLQPAQPNSIQALNAEAGLSQGANAQRQDNESTFENLQEGGREERGSLVDLSV